MKKTVLRSDDLSCPSCVPRIEKALGSMRGVKVATVSFNTGRIEIEHEPDVRGDDLVAVVRDAGYTARVAPF
jgi:copper chaperone